MEKKPKKPKCWNCKHGGQTFKIVGKTHLHCHNQEKYPDADMESGKISPWDTLMEGYYYCDKHEFKETAVCQK
jgi:hypothetical protein